MVILFIATIADFGIAIDRRQVLQHAVREGARYAAVHTSAADIQAYTSAQAQEIVDDVVVNICYIDSNGSGVAGDPGDAVRVRINFTYDLLLVGPILSGLFGGSVGSIDMSPSGTARLERSVSGAPPC